MTAEQPKSIYAGIWPMEVVPSNIDTLTNFRQQGNSLAASVAHTMRAESRELPDKLKDVTIKHALSHNISFYGALRLSMNVLYSYRKAFIGMLNTEEMLRNGEMWSAPLSLEKQEDNERFYKKFIQNPDPIAEQEVIDSMTVYSASVEVKYATLAHKLTQSSPLEVVDFIISIEDQELAERKTEDPYEITMNQEMRFALERGRLRFHQLYEAGQKAGLEPPKVIGS